MSAAASPPPPPAEVVEADVARALAEDLGGGDVTAALLPDIADSAYLLCKEDAVVCGRPWFDACHRALDPDVRIDWRVDEGDACAPGTVLATLQGRARALVSAERASLNFLQTLSRHGYDHRNYVEAVRGTRAQILDTRKTIPGLRLAQKYAVRVGGGVNHRIGLYDAVMLKENHVRAAGSLTAAIRAARAMHPSLPLIVEVESIAQLEEALARGLRPYPDRRFRCGYAARGGTHCACAPFNGAHSAGSFRRRRHGHAAFDRRRRRRLHLDRRTHQARPRDRPVAEARPAAVEV